MSTSRVDPARPADGRAGGTYRVTVRVPAPLRRLSGDRAAVPLDVTPKQSGVVSVGDVLSALASLCPGVHDAAVDERGAVRQHVNVFVGPDNIRFAAGLATPVPAGAEVWILPAVSGG